MRKNCEIIVSTNSNAPKSIAELYLLFLNIFNSQRKLGIPSKLKIYSANFPWGIIDLYLCKHKNYHIMLKNDLKKITVRNQRAKEATAYVDVPHPNN